MFKMFNLKNDSFPVTPGDLRTVEWYGFKSLKQQFEDSIYGSLSNHSRICVLNRGKMGAGKTNAARFFARDLLNKKMGLYDKIISIIIEAPKQPNQAFIEFSQRLINAITFNKIFKASKKMRDKNGKEALYTGIMEFTGNEDIAEVLSNIDESNRLESKTYLAGGGTARDLRKLKVSRKLKSPHDFAISLVGILFLLIHGASKKTGGLTRIILWVDEMEDLVYFLTKDFLPFTQALRELIDKMNHHFTILFNFTFSEPEDLSAIASVLGEAIMQRVDSHIVFEDAKKEDLREYLLELLRNNRLDSKEKNKYYPFTKDSFETLISAAIDNTPRYLNEMCSYILINFAKTKEYNIDKKNPIDNHILDKELPLTLKYLDDIRA